MPEHRKALRVLGLIFLLSTEVWAQATLPASEATRSDPTEVGVGGGLAAFPWPPILFGQASWGRLPEKGPGLRLGVMGTFWPDWHHDFILVGTLDIVAKISQTGAVKSYAFVGPCALISPFFRLWFSGGIGTSGILDAKHRSCFYGELRLLPTFGYSSLSTGVTLSAGIKFNF